MNDGMAKLVAIIFLYLSDNITGREFVSVVDRLVSNDELIALLSICQDDFDSLHDKLASCVWDERTYLESPGIYINETEMREAVKVFISTWGQSMAQHILKDNN